MSEQDAPEQNEQKQPEPSGAWRYVLAIVIGLIGAFFVWAVSPLNNLLIGANSGDSHMPLYGIIFLLVLVLFLNPLLRRFARRWALRPAQLAVVLGILLMAASLPGYGVLRTLPHGLSHLMITVSEKRNIAESFEKMDLSPRLFPEKLGFGAPTPHAEHMLTELPPGESVPWRIWLWPLLTWGLLLGAMWMMMIGLGLIVFPQWRRNERLAFPILTVFREFTEDPGEGHLFPPLFRSRAFWVASGAVFLLHFLSGASTYNPERVPSIPLAWDLSKLFQEDPWRHIPRHIYQGRLYFAFIGIAYFMPNRISFSVWFFALGYAFYHMLCRVYFPSVNAWSSVGDHRAGAMIGVAAYVVWLGRAHWGRVFRSLVLRPKTDEDARNQTAGYLFVLGCIGIVTWLVWHGMQPGWALMWLGFLFVIAIVMTRVVAETGVPFLRSYTNFMELLVLAPTAWISGVTLFFSMVSGLIISIHSRVCAATMATHAFGLAERTGPRRQRSMAWVLLAVFAIGLVVGGAIHLKLTYHHSMSLDGQTQPLNGVYNTLLSREVKRWLPEHTAGELSRPVYGRGWHVLVGMGLAGGLQWACLNLPKWPIHPVGIILAFISYGNRTWFSVLLGWLIKTLLVRYGGSRLFRMARPVFLGLIIGEIFAAIFWGLLPAFLHLLGHQYKVIDVVPF